jgi:hypothetical protein
MGHCSFAYGRVAIWRLVRPGQPLLRMLQWCDGSGVGHAAVLHGSVSGIANAPNTALQLTDCTAGDVVGYFCVAGRDGP